MGGGSIGGGELLSKPYSREDLAFKLRAMLGERPRQAHAQAPVVTQYDEALHPDEAGRRVLVVDDDGQTREAVSELLILLGHHPFAAGNARAALDAASRDRFDVLVTDINLPDLSGIELARHIAGNHAAMQVIFASGEALSPEQLDGMTCRVLRKPYALEELKAAILDPQSGPHGRDDP